MTPAFGATSTGAFGASTTPFGGSQAGATNAFGARPATTGFGAAATPAFGAAPQTSAFGGSPGAASPFGVGGQQQQGFGFGGAAGSSPAFGQQPGQTASVFGGAGGAFGQQPTAVGTKQVPYQVTAESETSGNNSTMVKYQTITMMQAYRGKSVEELRFEDYQNGVKGGQGGMGQPGFGGGGFNQTGMTGAFGMSAAVQTSSPSPFGSSLPSFGMGGAAQSAPAFGASPGMTSGGAFGQTASPFGASPSQPAFGAAGSSPAFGATPTPATGGFGFGAASGQSSPAFGAGGTFGQQPAASGIGAFGQQQPAASTSPFGASTLSTPAFGGSNTSQPFGSTGAFGASSSPAFGAASASAFGAAASTPAFGAASTPAFGAASTPALTLGATPSMPAFGSTTAPAQTSFGGFGATASSQPAFGASSTPAFGASAAAKPAFGGFGATTTATGSTALGGGFSLGQSSPAATTGSLFGQSTSTFGGGGLSAAPSLFSMSQAATGTTPTLGGLGTATQAQATPSLFGSTGAGGLGSTTPTFGGLGTPSLNTTPAAASPGGALAPQSPYGGLPAAPTPSVGTPNSATLAARQAPQRVSGLTATNMMAPRTIVPRSTIRIRPRQSKDIVPQNKSPHTFFYTPDSERERDKADMQSIFKVRENPRTLFLRKLPPSEPKASAQQSEGEQEISLQLPAPATAGASLRASAESAQRSRSPATPGADDDQALKGRDGNIVVPLAKRGGIRMSSPDKSGERSPLQSVASLVPKLSPQSQRSGYFTVPRQDSMTQVARTDPDYLSRVPDFVVGRDGYGKCKWKGEVDVRGMNLSDIVVFGKDDSKKAYIKVYPDEKDKPDLGLGLNRPAEITLYDVFITIKGERVTQGPQVDKFRRRLQAVEGTSFVSYSADEGEWVFEVEHFSQYGVPDDDDDDDGEEEGEEEGSLGRKGGQDFAGGGVAAVPGNLSGNFNDLMDAEDYDEEYPLEGQTEMKESLSSPLIHSLPNRLGLDASEMYAMRSAMFGGESKRGPVGGGGRHLVEKGARWISDGILVEPPREPRTRKFVPLLPAPTPRRDATALTSKRPSRVGHEGSPQDSRNVVDMGLVLGQSFRVGWGPGGKFFHSGSPPCPRIITRSEPAVAEDDEVDKHSYVHARQILPRAAVMAADSNALRGFYESTVGVHMQLSGSQPDSDGVSKWEVLVSPSTLIDVCRELVGLWKSFLEYDTGIDVRSFIRTLVLLKVLVEEDPDEGAFGEENEIVEWDLRRRARMGRWLSEWNEKSLRRNLEENMSEDSSLRVLYLLIGRDLPLASSVAAQGRDFRLATLVAQGSVSGAGRQALHDQLELWEREGFVPYIDEDRLRVYQMLAGHVDVGIRELPLDWRCAFAAYFWYGIGVRESLNDAVSYYFSECMSMKAPRPLPEHAADVDQEGVEVYDIDFYLMQIRCADETAVQRMLTPKSSSNDPIDFQLQWLLGTILYPLGVCPVVDALHSVVSGFAYQLELLGYVDLAIYVLTTAPNGGDGLWAGIREKAVKDLVFRYAKTWLESPSQARFLVDKVGIPVQWISESMAYIAATPEDEVAALIGAEMFSDAHRVFISLVAPTMILEGRMDDVCQFLEALGRDHEIDIENWSIGGGVLLNFYDADRLVGDGHGALSNDEIEDIASRLARGADLWSSPNTSVKARRAEAISAFKELLRTASGWLHGDAFLSKSSEMWLSQGSSAELVYHVQEAASRLCEDASFFL